LKNQDKFKGQSPLQALHRRNRSLLHWLTLACNHDPPVLFANTKCPSLPHINHEHCRGNRRSSATTGLRPANSRRIVM